MKITVDYDPMSGNITSSNGYVYFVGMNLSFPAASDNTTIQDINTEIVKLSNNGMTADDLIKMRKAGVI